MKKVLSIINFLLVISVAWAQNPKAVKSFNKANEELEKGNKSKAFAYLNKAIKLDSKYADPWSLKAYIYEKSKDSANACLCYRGAIKADPLYQSGYYYYAKYLYDLNRFDEAISELNKFNKVELDPKFNPKKDKSNGKITKEAAKLIDNCFFSKNEVANLAILNIKNMGTGINSKMWEYWPGMTIDGKYFLMTRLMGLKENRQEDFYQSTRTDTGWSKAIELPGNINTAKNEGNTSVTPDGKFIYYTVCEDRNAGNEEVKEGKGSCDIYYSSYSASKNTWSKRVNLGGIVNSTEWDAHPSISADGKSIIFSSTRKGGFGGMDLWISHWVNGAWTMPENLGSTINTSDNESAPFLHYDGKSLYFSSNGHPGVGGQDIFLSRKGADGKWTTPVNLGKGINTASEEVGLYVEYSGKKGYFSSDRPGGFGGVDIYSFDLSEDKRPGPVSYVQGTVLDDETKKEIAGRIEVVDLKNKQVILRDSAFSFFTTMEPGGNYALNVYRKGYLFYSANFQPEPAKIDSPYSVVALLKAIKNNQHIVLNNIFFDVDKYDLKPESVSELNAVLALLRANATMEIEIEGYTDNSGLADHNQVLSENRAKSVYGYLVKEGIVSKRIKFKGYGAEKPIADNNTEIGRAQNRRIEMRVTHL